MSQPRILVLNQYYAPALESTGQLLTQLCEDLAADHDVTVVTAVAENCLQGREAVNGVEVLRVWSTSFERRQLAKRAINYLTYTTASIWAALAARPPDVVLCMSDPPFVPAFARLAAKRFGVPYIAIVQDVFPEIAVELGRLRNPALVRLLDVLVTSGLQHASRVVAIGETMRERLVEKGVPRDRIRVIRNWVDTTELQPEPKANRWAREHELDDKFVVMHSGNVGYAQSLDVLIRATSYLRDLENLRVVVIGSGARQADLVELSGLLETDRVVFCPYQPRAVLSESLSTADLHFVGLAPGLSGYIVPSRMNGVMSVARPVVVGADEQSEIVKVVEAAACGVVIKPGRPELLAEVIRDSHDGRYELDAMGRNGREYVEREASRSVAIAMYRALISELTEKTQTL